MLDRPGLQEHAVWREYCKAWEDGNFLLSSAIQVANPDLILTPQRWYWAVSP